MEKPCCTYVILLDTVSSPWCSSTLEHWSKRSSITPSSSSISKIMNLPIKSNLLMGHICQWWWWIWWHSLQPDIKLNCHCAWHSYLFLASQFWGNDSRWHWRIVTQRAGSVMKWSSFLTGALFSQFSGPTDCWKTLLHSLCKPVITWSLKASNAGVRCGKAPNCVKQHWEQKPAEDAISHLGVC